MRKPENLADAACLMALRACIRHLLLNGVTQRDVEQHADVIAATVKQFTKEAFCDALAHAMEAAKHATAEVAKNTFAFSCAVAGIEAARHWALSYVPREMAA